MLQKKSNISFIFLIITVLMGCSISSQHKDSANLPQHKDSADKNPFFPPQHEHIQHLEITTQHTVRSEKETYVKPSTTQKLNPGERVDCPDLVGREYVVQRLTDRSYWMISNAFTTMAFVGDQGVLLLDAPGSLDPSILFPTLKQFTDLPVTALAYSHAHVDHNGGSFRLKKALEQQGRSLRIVGSEQLASEIKKYGEPVVTPTDVVPRGSETFEFEKWTFKLVTPVNFAHSGADSYILAPDGVIKYVDFNYPGRLPLAYISSSQSITGWIEFLRHVLGEEWIFADLGHANVGNKADIQLTFDYLSDLYDAYFTVVAPVWEKGKYFEPGLMVKSPDDSAGVFWENIVNVSAEKMAHEVYEKWKDQLHAEVIRSHAYKVFEDAFLHYNWSNNHGIRPDFSPIDPSSRNRN